MFKALTPSFVLSRTPHVGAFGSAEFHFLCFVGRMGIALISA